MKKIIHWFMSKMVVKIRDTRSTSDFSPLVNWQVTSTIIKRSGIVHAFGKKYDKPYLFFNFERTDVDGLDYYTWEINVQSDINIV